MSVFRSKYNIAVFETTSKVSKQFVHHALINGHKIIALTNNLQVDDISKNPNFTLVPTYDHLFEHAEVVVITGGAEHHAAAARAVKAVIKAVHDKKAPKLKHIYLVSASGAKANSGFLQGVLYSELHHAEKSLAELAAKDANIKFTIFRPPTLIEADKPNDVFVFDEANETGLQDLSHQVTYTGVADAVLEILETQRFINKVAGINSKQALIDAKKLRAVQTRKAVHHAFFKFSPIVIGAVAVFAGLAFWHRRNQ